MSFAITIAGVRDAIAQQPHAAAAAFRAEHALLRNTEVAVQLGNHSLRVDEPPALGGGAQGPNPVELALASLGSCQAITYQVWAALQGVQVDRIDVRVEGDLDLRGFFGVDQSVRPGFGAVRVVLSVSGPESEERYRALQREADRYCPVLDIFQNPVPVSTVFEVEPQDAVRVA
jgi:uncharacterized OsmC-like protein